MIDPVFKSNNYLLAQKLLDASALRQEALAANIANLETPGYRRIDLAPDFATQLKSRLDDGTLGSAAASLKPSLAVDPFARIIRPDGNTVELEREMLEMNRNSVGYDFLTELVSRNIKQLKMAISGRSM